jgi:hypothetical protein
MARVNGGAVVEVPHAVLAELAGPVAAGLPFIAARIPGAPAAELGRLRATADGHTLPIRSPATTHRAMVPLRSGVRPGSGDSSVRDALGSLPPLLIERLLGALELAVPQLDLAGPPELTGFLDEPFTDTFSIVSVDGQSEAVTGTVMLERIRPGVVPLVAALARRLATHPQLAAHLTVGPDCTDESGVATAHGAAHLALAVATAAAVLHRVDLPPWATQPPAVLGVAIGTAVLLLRETPMPAGYAAALLARTRAEYLLPRQSSGSAPVSGHRFALLEGAGVPEVDFTGNGLVAVVPGGAVIRTGVEAGYVRILLNILEGPPPEVETGWEEIVEVSWRAAVGGAFVAGPHAGEPHLHRATPPWPGDYRLRVHARGRDDTHERGAEYYQLMVWQAPAAETVCARTDRARSPAGEPEPARLTGPKPPTGGCAAPSARARRSRW